MVVMGTCIGYSWVNILVFQVALFCICESGYNYICLMRIAPAVFMFDFFQRPREDISYSARCYFLDQFHAFLKVVFFKSLHLGY